MGYLFLSVVFYTVVRFGIQIWERLRNEKRIKITISEAQNQLIKLVNKVIEKL